MRAHSLQIGIIIFCLVLGSSAHARQVYRCGKTLQDRPCDGTGNSVPIANTTVPASRQDRRIDSKCAQRGANAQKIMWAREAGQTMDQQLAKVGWDLRPVVMDVYGRSGSAPEVRSAVEDECVLERERNAAMADTGRPFNPGAAGSAATTQGNDQPRTQAGAAAVAPVQNENKARCSAIASRNEEIRKQQNSGGSTAEMENLRKQKRMNDQELRDTGC